MLSLFCLRVSPCLVERLLLSSWFSWHHFSSTSSSAVPLTLSLFSLSFSVHWLRRLMCSSSVITGVYNRTQTFLPRAHYVLLVIMSHYDWDILDIAIKSTLSKACLIKKLMFYFILVLAGLPSFFSCALVSDLNVFSCSLRSLSFLFSSSSCERVDITSDLSSSSLAESALDSFARRPASLNCRPGNLLKVGYHKLHVHAHAQYVHVCTYLIKQWL